MNAVYERASAQKTSAAAEARSGKAARRSAEAQVLATYAKSFKIADVNRFSRAHLPWVYERYAAL